jgi:hypothetical protein
MVRDIREAVEEYFEEEGITDLMDYGASDDEGLGTISNVVADCLVKVGYPVAYDYAKDSKYGDGKYVINIGCLDKDFKFEISAWNGVDEVVDIIETILE